MRLPPTNPEAGCAGRREEPWELSASRPPTGEAHAPNGAAPAGSPSSTGRDFIDKHIKPMSEDLEKKRTLFMDDASFISEACLLLPSQASHTQPGCCREQLQTHVYLSVSCRYHQHNGCIIIW